MASRFIAGFLAYFGSTAQHLDAQHSLLVVLLLAAGAFLLKAGYYAVRASWVLKGYELKPDFPLELQRNTLVDSLQFELEWRVWETEQLQLASVRRLFFLNRTQRNFVAGLACFLGVAATHVLSRWLDLSAPIWAALVAAAWLTLVVLLLDALVERMGSFWN